MKLPITRDGSWTVTAASLSGTNLLTAAFIFWLVPKKCTFVHAQIAASYTTLNTKRYWWGLIGRGYLERWVGGYRFSNWSIPVFELTHPERLCKYFYLLPRVTSHAVIYVMAAGLSFYFILFHFISFYFILFYFIFILLNEVATFKKHFSTESCHQVTIFRMGTWHFVVQLKVR